MYQGNIGYFRNMETGEGAWLWKLHAPTMLKSSGFPMYVNLETGEKLTTDDVTDNLQEGKRKKWVIETELEGDELISTVKFTPPDVTEIVNKKKFHELAERRRRLIEKGEHIEEEIVQAREFIDKKTKELEETEHSIWSVINEIDLMDAKDKTVYIVHAVHSATDSVDYQWYADPELGESLNPGDRVLVNTARGEDLAIVRTVEKVVEPVNLESHKWVMRKV